MITINNNTLDFNDNNKKYIILLKYIYCKNKNIILFFIYLNFFNDIIKTIKILIIIYIHNLYDIICELLYYTLSY